MVNYSLIERNLNYTNSIMCCTTAEEDNTKNSYMIKFVKTFFCKIFLGVVYTIGGKYVFFVLILYIKILIFFNYKQEKISKKKISKKRFVQENFFQENFFKRNVFFQAKAFFSKKLYSKKIPKKAFSRQFCSTTIFFNNNFFQ